jgi:hypothetical protein
VFGGLGTFRIGEVDGRIIDRLLALHDALRAVQEVEVTANIAGYLWAKLALGAIYFCDGAGQRRRDGAVRPADVPRHVRRTRWSGDDGGTCLRHQS